MAVSISKLRSDIYRLIDEVLATGEPLEIERRGQILRITRDNPASKIDRIVPIPDLIVGDPQDLVSIDWSEHWSPYLGDEEPAPAHRADAGVIYLDTHVALWLASGNARAIPASILAMIEGRRVLLSPIAALEMDLLHEIGRINAPSAAILSTLARSLGLALCDLAFAEVTREAAALTWTRDPFDRLITAQAQARQAPLATADGVIREHYAAAVWD